MLEQELERLRQVANRLTDAHQEALDAVDRALEYRGEQGLVDDEARASSASEHLEATLVDVRDILEGASADVRGLLEGREQWAFAADAVQHVASIHPAAES